MWMLWTVYGFVQLDTGQLFPCASDICAFGVCWTTISKSNHVHIFGRAVCVLTNEKLHETNRKFLPSFLAWNVFKIGQMGSLAKTACNENRLYHYRFYLCKSKTHASCFGIVLQREKNVIRLCMYRVLMWRCSRATRDAIGAKFSLVQRGVAR